MYLNSISLSVNILPFCWIITLDVFKFNDNLANKIKAKGWIITLDVFK